MSVAGRFPGRGGRIPSDAGGESPRGRGRGGGGRGHSHGDAGLLIYCQKQGNYASWARRMVIDAVAEFPRQAEYLSYMTKITGTKLELVMPKLSDHVSVEAYGAVAPVLHVVPLPEGEITGFCHYEWGLNRRRPTSISIFGGSAAPPSPSNSLLASDSCSRSRS